MIETIQHDLLQEEEAVTQTVKTPRQHDEVIPITKDDGYVSAEQEHRSAGADYLAAENVKWLAAENVLDHPYEPDFYPYEETFEEQISQ